MIWGKFEPVVEPRMNVRLLPDYGYFKVLGVEPIGVIVYDFGKTLTAGSESKNIEFSTVYMQENEMAQWRVWVLDDFEIRLKLVGRERLRGSTKYSSDSIVTFSMDTNDYDELSQFFTFEDEKVFVDIKNPTQDTITKERVMLMGFKYVLQKLEEKPEKWTDIPIGVVSSLSVVR